MAGDWIKVEKATASKPEIMRLARILGIHIDEALGVCVRFWIWCDEHLANGCIAVEGDDVDRFFSRPGLSAALVSAGWLRVRNGALEIPNSDRHLSQTAKKRSDAARRQAKSRDSSHANVTKSCDQSGEEKSSPSKTDTDRAGEAARGSPPQVRIDPSGLDPIEQQFFAAWRAKGSAVVQPVITCMTQAQRELFQQRLGDPVWLELAHAALGKLPQAWMDRPVGLMQFLRPGGVEELLEWSEKGGKSRETRRTRTAGNAPRRSAAYNPANDAD